LEYIPTAPEFATGISSFREFDKQYCQIDTELLELSNGFMQKLFLQFPISHKLNHEELLVHMVKTTSAGCPFKGDKRKYLFHENWEVFILSLLEMLDKNRYIFVWRWAQKYELRTLEKAIDKKIRGFCVSPVDHCYLQSMYFTNFNDHLFSMSVDSEFPSAVGMSKYSLGFHKLALNLLRFPNIYYTDFSGFDSCLSPQLLIDNFMFKCSYMDIDGVDFQRMWKLLLSNIYSAVCIEDGSVYVKEGGNPSGQSNTISDNTLINIRIFYMAYIYNCIRVGKYVMVSLSDFSNHVYVKCYGDDIIFSVSNEVNEFFNFNTFSDFCSQNGFKIKGNEKPCTIYEAEFLSHHLIRYKDFWYLPVPDDDKILSSLVLGGFNDAPLYNLLRALSLRIESWPSKRCREHIEDYLAYVYSHCDEDLQGEYQLADDQYISLDSLKDLYFTDSEIESLYISLESGISGDVLNKFSHFKNLARWYGIEFDIRHTNINSTIF